jgi:hypothetical protein
VSRLVGFLAACGLLLLVASATQAAPGPSNPRSVAPQPSSHAATTRRSASEVAPAGCAYLAFRGSYYYFFKRRNVSKCLAVAVARRFLKTRRGSHGFSCHSSSYTPIICSGRRKSFSMYTESE